MDLIERYLTAVGVLLPRAGRADILTELRDVLMNRREEKQEELGRPLTPGEDAALLRAFGHPISVAGRYGRQQYLIGPDLYPLYIVAVKVLVAIQAAGAVIAAVVRMAVVGQTAQMAIGGAFGQFWGAAISSVGALTIIAAILQWQNIRLSFLDNWNPRDLPKPVRFRRETWVHHVASIVAQTVFILWWTGMIHFWPSVIGLPSYQGVVVAPAPVWAELYWAILAFAAGNIVVDLIKLMGQAWRRLAYGADILVQTGAVIIAAVALRAGDWLTVSGTGLPIKSLHDVDLALHLSFQLGLTVIIVASAGMALYDMWRLFRTDAAKA